MVRNAVLANREDEKWLQQMLKNTNTDEFVSAGAILSQLERLTMS
jgi:hypothetical protein